MKAIYGVTHHNPARVDELVKQSLNQIADSKLSYQFINVGDTYNGKARIVVCVTLAMFLKNLDAFQESKAVIFLVDSPLLCDTIQPITLLDCEKHNNFRYSFRPLTDDSVLLAIQHGTQQSVTKVAQATLDLIPTLLDSTVSSLLNPIQQFLYAVSDAERRTRYRRAIYVWLMSDEPLDSLKAALKEVSGGRVTERHKELVLFFKGDGQKLQQILGEVRTARAKNKPVNHKKLCKQYGIQKFDLKYLLTSIKKTSGVLTEVDALEDARKRKQNTKKLSDNGATLRV